MDIVYYIGIAASSEEPVPRILESNAKEFIDELSEFRNNIRLIVGGYWGLMKIVADYAKNKGIEVIFILPEFSRAMPPRIKEFIPIYTELGYKTRSVILTSTSDVLVCLGGRIGSIIEIMLAYGFSKPVVILRGYNMDTDKIEEAFGEYIDSRKLAKVYYASTGREAAKIALNLLGLTT